MLEDMIAEVRKNTKIIQQQIQEVGDMSTQLGPLLDRYEELRGKLSETSQSSAEFTFQQRELLEVVGKIADVIPEAATFDATGKAIDIYSDKVRDAIAANKRFAVKNIVTNLTGIQKNIAVVTKLIGAYQQELQAGEGDTESIRKSIRLLNTTLQNLGERYRETIESMPIGLTNIADEFQELQNAGRSTGKAIDEQLNAVIQRGFADSVTEAKNLLDAVNQLGVQAAVTSIQLDKLRVEKVTPTPRPMVTKEAAIPLPVSEAYPEGEVRTLPPPKPRVGPKFLTEEGEKVRQREIKRAEEKAKETLEAEAKQAQRIQAEIRRAKEETAVRGLELSGQSFQAEMTKIDNELAQKKAAVDQEVTDYAEAQRLKADWDARYAEQRMQLLEEYNQRYMQQQEEQQEKAKEIFEAEAKVAAASGKKLRKEFNDNADKIAKITQDLADRQREIEIQSLQDSGRTEEARLKKLELQYEKEARTYEEMLKDKTITEAQYADLSKKLNKLAVAHIIAEWEGFEDGLEWILNDSEKDWEDYTDLIGRLSKKAANNAADEFGRMIDNINREMKDWGSERKPVAETAGAESRDELERLSEESMRRLEEQVEQWRQDAEDEFQKLAGPIGSSLASAITRGWDKGWNSVSIRSVLDAIVKAQVAGVLAEAFVEKMDVPISDLKNAIEDEDWEAVGKHTGKLIWEGQKYIWEIQAIPELQRLFGKAPLTLGLKKPATLQEIKTGGGIFGKEANEQITAGAAIQISQITGSTRDILVSLLSPLKQLNTTFPAMLDELKAQTHLLSVGLPNLDGQQEIAVVDGQQETVVMPAPDKGDVLANLLSPLGQLNTTFPAILDELKTQTNLLAIGLPNLDGQQEITVVSPPVQQEIIEPLQAAIERAQEGFADITITGQADFDDIFKEVDNLQSKLQSLEWMTITDTSLTEIRDSVGSLTNQFARLPDELKSNISEFRNLNQEGKDTTDVLRQITTNLKDMAPNIDDDEAKIKNLAVALGEIQNIGRQLRDVSFDVQLDIQEPDIQQRIIEPLTTAINRIQGNLGMSIDTSKALSPLLDQYDELKQKLSETSQSSAEFTFQQGELQSVIERIVELMPEAASSFDEAGKAIDINISQIKKSITSLNAIGDIDIAGRADFDDIFKEVDNLQSKLQSLEGISIDDTSLREIKDIVGSLTTQFENLPDELKTNIRGIAQAFDEIGDRLNKVPFDVQLDIQEPDIQQKIIEPLQVAIERAQKGFADITITGQADFDDIFKEVDNLQSKLQSLEGISIDDTSLAEARDAVGRLANEFIKLPDELKANISELRNLNQEGKDTTYVLRQTTANLKNMAPGIDEDETKIKNLDKTGDVLANSLSPLGQLNTIFPYTLDELKAQTHLLSVGLPNMGGQQEIVAGQPPDSTEGILANPLLPLEAPNPVFPAILDELKIQTNLLAIGLPNLSKPQRGTPGSLTEEAGITVEGDVHIHVQEVSEITPEEINRQLHRETRISKRRTGAA